MKKGKARHIAVVVTVFLASDVLTPLVPAMAAERMGIEESVDSISRADPTIMDESVNLSRVASEGSSVVRNEGIDITVHDDVTEQISIVEDDGSEIGLRLPFFEEADSGEVSADGLLVFDNGNGSRTAPVPREDGSIQVNTVIESSVAPKEYQYKFSSSEGLEIHNEGGLVIFSGSDQKFLGALAPAWAKDALGNDVATSYRVEGDTLTQVIEHGRGSEYPIVADPWLGVKLWKKITVNTYRNQPRVNLNLSRWGWAVWSGAAQGGGAVGFAAGQTILNNAGWTEARNRSSKVRRALGKKSQRQQYECHALGALFAGEWNLEKFRPNRTRHWSYGVARHRCNWTTAGRY